METKQRLIDANELRAKAKLRGILDKSGKVTFRKCILLEDLDSAPAVEVKPVAEVKSVTETKPNTVHGAWVQRYFEMYCNKCWTECPTKREDGKLKYTYPCRCPNCNAIMDGSD